MIDPATRTDLRGRRHRGMAANRPRASSTCLSASTSPTAAAVAGATSLSSIAAGSATRLTNCSAPGLALDARPDRSSASAATAGTAATTTDGSSQLPEDGGHRSTASSVDEPARSRGVGAIRERAMPRSIGRGQYAGRRRATVPAARRLTTRSRSSGSTRRRGCVASSGRRRTGRRSTAATSISVRASRCCCRADSCSRSARRASATCCLSRSLGGTGRHAGLPGGRLRRRVRRRHRTSGGVIYVACSDGLHALSLNAQAKTFAALGSWRVTVRRGRSSDRGRRPDLVRGLARRHARTDSTRRTGNVTFSHEPRELRPLRHAKRRRWPAFRRQRRSGDGAADRRHRLRPHRPRRR